MSAGGHRTSTISRPATEPSGADGPQHVRPAHDRPDLTTPIPRDKQLARGRSSKLIIGLLGFVVVAALEAALFVLPVRDWIDQRDDLAERQQELAALEKANDDLQREVDRLQTPEGIEEAARQEIGYVGQGDRRMSVLPLPGAPTTLPAGWPYDQVTQIVALRVAEAAAQGPPASP